MKIFKFGGGVLNSYESINHLSEIVIAEKPSLIVISALHKSTNALEKICSNIILKIDYDNLVIDFFDSCFKIADGVYENEEEKTIILKYYRSVLDSAVEKYREHRNEEQLYSSLVSIGELLTSKVIYDFLLRKYKDTVWIDARTILKTNNRFCSSEIDWHVTQKNVENLVLPPIESGKIIITQGFIASNIEGETTTLGREGSDYTAAIFATCLKAESVVLYKNVSGVMTANPNYFPLATKLDYVSYDFMNEMTHYGAKIVHERTIDPLHKNNIPLFIKKFQGEVEDVTLVQMDMPNIKETILVDRNCIFVSLSLNNISYAQMMGDIIEFLKEHGASVLIENKGEKLRLCISTEYHDNSKLVADFYKEFHFCGVTVEDASIITVLFTDNFKPYFSTNIKVLIWQYNKGICQVVIKRKELEEYARRIEKSIA